MKAPPKVPLTRFHRLDIKALFSLSADEENELLAENRHRNTGCSRMSDTGQRTKPLAVGVVSIKVVG